MELPNPEHFYYRDCEFSGDACWLIYPKQSDGDKIWMPDNLRFRSCVVRKSDSLKISQSFPKFFNYSQCPHLYPDPNQYGDWEILEKLDGSALICSTYRGKPIIRTRQAPDFSAQPNATEIQSVLDAPNFQKFLKDSILETHTVIFEYLSVLHTIVIKHKEPELVLLDIIDTQSAKSCRAQFMGVLAQKYGFRTPKVYSFSSISDIIENCKTLENMEGYVLNFMGGQQKVKLKADAYLLKHRLKSHFDTINHTLDYWFAAGKPGSEDFFALVEKEVDFETADGCRDFIRRISEASVKVSCLLYNIASFAGTVRQFPRKVAAEQILQGEWRGKASLAFMLLDSKEIPDKVIRNLMEEYINNGQSI